MKQKLAPQYLKSTCPTCGHRTIVYNGRWLRARRESAGLDQRTFARQLGLSGPYVSDIERNRRKCPDIIYLAYMDLKPLKLKRR